MFRIAPIAIAIALVLVASCGNDDTVVELGDGTANVRRHAIAFDGQTYAIAWTTSSGLLTDDRLWFARLAPDGGFAQPPTPVIDLAERITELALVTTPTRYVVWYRAASSAKSEDLFALGLDERGDITAPATMMGDADGTDPHTFAATWAEDRLIAVWHRSLGSVYEVRLGTFSPELARMSEAVVETTTVDRREPTVTWSAAEQRLLIAWQAGDRIRSARVQLDGALDGASAVIVETGSDQFGAALRAGDLALVGWGEDSTSDRRQLRFASATPGGAWRLYPAGLVPKNRYHGLDPMFDVRGGIATIAWASDAETALRQIEVGRLDLATGTELTDRRTVTNSQNDHFSPRVAAGATETGVVFQGTATGAVRLYFSTVP